LNVITTLKDKRREKQLKYERRLLREISLASLRSDIKQYFYEYTKTSQFTRHCEEYCIELAVESYLLGARYSKFGYYGEPLPQVRNRSIFEEKSLAEMLFHFLSTVPLAELPKEYRQKLHEVCESFISSWWKEGYEKGERRYRLRLR
jgi:hypothetical protein